MRFLTPRTLLRYVVRMIVLIAGLWLFAIGTVLTLDRKSTV